MYCLDTRLALYKQGNRAVLEAKSPQNRSHLEAKITRGNGFQGRMRPNSSKTAGNRNFTLVLPYKFII